MSIEQTRQLLSAYQNQVAGQLNQAPSVQPFVDPRASWELEDSAIKNPWNRVKYGVADRNGQYKILTQDEGYSPEQIITLKNGELGVKTPLGIKPIDPKGFQMKDTVGDVAESLGGLLPIGGQMLGTSIGSMITPGAGSIAGAGIGAGTGEYARQKIGEFLGVREGGTTNEEANSIAAAGIFGAGSQAASLGIGKLLSSMQKVGSVKTASGSDVMAQVTRGVGIDDTTAIGKGLGTGRTMVSPEIAPKGVTTEIANVLNNQMGIKNLNSEITKTFYGKGLPVVENMDDLAKNVNSGLTNLVENKNSVLFDRFLKPALEEKAAQQGVQNLDDVVFSWNPTRQTLKALKSSINKEVMLPSQKAAQLAAVDDAINMVKGTKTTTYGAFKDTANKISNLVKQAKDTGDYNTANLYSKIYDALVDSRASELPQEAFKGYSAARQTLSKLDDLFRVRLTDAGEVRPGSISMVGRLARFGDEIKRPQDFQLLQDLMKEAKNVGIEGTENLSDDIVTFLYNNALSKAKPDKGALGKIIHGIPVVSGVADVLTSGATNPFAQARAVKFGFDTGIMDASKLSARVGEAYFPRINAMSKLLNIPNPTQNPMVGAVVSKTGKVVVKSRGAVAGQSLNKLLYGRDSRQ